VVSAQARGDLLTREAPHGRRGSRARPEKEGQARHRVASHSVGGPVPRIQVVRGIPGLGETYALTTLITSTERVAGGRRDSISRSPRNEPIACSPQRKFSCTRS
jgi:hypothetical protein